MSAILHEQRLTRLLIGDYPLDPDAVLRALTRRETHQRRERHFLRRHLDFDEPEVRNIKQHTDQLPLGIEQAAADAFDQYLAVDPGGKVLLVRDGSSHIEGTAAGGDVHRQNSFGPGSAVDRD